MAAGPESTVAPSVSRRAFGRLVDGRAVEAHTLSNGRGLALTAINWGGVVTSVTCPDRDGRAANVVLGFAGLDDYVQRNPHFGTLVGRCANRIDRGRFELDGNAYQLPLNDPPNSLHGGTAGFGSRWWAIEPMAPAADGSVALALAYDSEDGEEGYPGRLQARVRYTLTPAGEWVIDYEARTDRPTIVNLTHHAYWNLAGQGSVLAHRLTLHASRYARVNADLIPEAFDDVTGTPFDFRTATPIEARLRTPHPQLLHARGYDHHWVLDRAPADAAADGAMVLAPAARLEDPASGRVLEIATTEPGVQFYSGNFLDGRLVGSGGAVYRQGDGLCLETQHPPNAVNRGDFPSVRLDPGRVFQSRTVHRFTTDAGHSAGAFPEPPPSAAFPGA